MLDALVDRQDADVAGAGQAAAAVEPLEVAESRGAAIAVEHHAVDEVGAGQMQQALVDGLAAVREQRVGLRAEQRLDCR